jgi:ribonuclease R
MTRIPSKDEILAWISDHPAETSKRDIARAFGIKGAARVDLKRVLKELEADGHLEKRRKTYRDPDRLPPVSVLEVLGPDGEGDLFVKPLEWTGEGAEPRVLLIPREGDPALGRGDRILGRLTEVEAEGHDYEARLIRRIGQTAHRILGVFRKTAEGGRIVPIDKGAEREWTVAPGATLSARDGELVEAELAGPKVRMGLPRARVITRLGDPSEPKRRLAHRDPSAWHSRRLPRCGHRRGRRDETRGPRRPRGPPRPAPRDDRPRRCPRP